jgi:hypothetical protein
MPYDRYGYTVTSSSNPGIIGHLMYVDVPKTPQVLAVTRDYFNKVANAGKFQITKDLLPDTPYNLSTYPTAPMTAQSVPVNVGLATPLNSIVVPWAHSGLNTLGEGNGTTQVTIDTSQGSSGVSGQTFGADFEAELIVGDVVAGFNLGFSVGLFHSVSVEHTLTFGGIVGQIPSPQYQMYVYNWGLDGYKQTLTDANGKAFQSFFVVNYWVVP